ncbi:MAG: type II secretion system F family protein [archaeon]
MRALFKKIAASIPGLQLKLIQAGMTINKEDFIRNTFFSSLYVTLGIILFVWMTLSRLRVGPHIFIITGLIMFFMLLNYFMRIPDVRINKQRRLIEREIVFAGRFLIVELESGVTLYNAMTNISNSFETTGKAFKEIIDRVDLGTAMEDAINETTQNTPSPELAKILWQILNVMKTGADISRSLSGVIEQIVREQMIEVKQYGKKLSPLAMFYMIMAVILPSIGSTAIIVVASFMALKLDLAVLLTIVGLLAFVQFMFLAIIKSSRPAVEI